MNIHLYKLPTIYERLEPIVKAKRGRLQMLGRIHGEPDILLIPNDRTLIDFIPADKTIVVMETMEENDLAWWLGQGILNCFSMDHDWEIEYMKWLYRFEENEKNAYQIALQKKFSVRAMKESLAYDLIHGKARDVREIYERSKLAQLRDLPNTVLLVSIDHFQRQVKEEGEESKNHIRKEVLYAIRAQLPFHASLIVLVKEDRFAILLPLPIQEKDKNDREVAMEQADKLQRAIAHTTVYTVTIGIGNRYEDTRDIHHSFKESEYAQSYRLFTDESTIIHIQDVDYYETASYEELKEKVQGITSVFVRGNLEEAHENCASLFAYVSKSKVEPLMFRLQMVEMLASMTEAAIHNGANPKQIMPLQIKYAKKMYDLETLQELEETMIEMMSNYIALVRETNNEMTLRSVQQVLDYMEEHYATDLGLEMLAELVELSPNYLSHLFKQTTGSSFVDYLTELRLKKAKEMLQTAHLTIYEIAEHVGFSSSQYFSRVFKRTEGVTPTAYRNNVLGTKHDGF